MRKRKSAAFYLSKSLTFFSKLKLFSHSDFDGIFSFPSFFGGNKYTKIIKNRREISA
jgi:hypothetical protein